MRTVEERYIRFRLMCTIAQQMANSFRGDVQLLSNLSVAMQYFSGFAQLHNFAEPCSLLCDPTMV